MIGLRVGQDIYILRKCFGCKDEGNRSISGFDIIAMSARVPQGEPYV